MSFNTVSRLIKVIRPWVGGFLLMSLLATLFIVPGRADGGLALQFDGVNDYVAFGDTGNLFGTDNWTSAKTVSLWIRVTGADAPVTSPPSGEIIIGNDAPRSFGISRAVYNGLDRIWLWNSDSNGVDTLGIPFTLGEWMQVALVHSGGEMYAYKDGLLVGSVVSGPTNIPNTTTGDGKLFVAGSGRSSAATYIEAEIDEVSFWNIDLDAGTIESWWNREVTPDHPFWANLAGYYQMSDGAGTLLSDNSGLGHTGTLLGGMSDANWVPSGALGGSTPADTPTPTMTLEPPSPTPTFTPEAPTSTPTETLSPTVTFTTAPPTDTPTSTATFTAAPPTETPTPTATAAPPTYTPTPTITSVPTDTPTPTATFTPVPPTPTATNTPTPTPTSTPPSGSGYALSFDGNNDYVKLYETYQMLDPGWEDTKTISLWILPTGDAPACYRNDVGACDNIFGDRPRWWGITRGVIFGEDRIWLFNTDGDMLSFTDKIGIPYTPGEWVHIAMVHSNGVMHAYKNGAEVGSIASGTTQQPNTNAHPVLYIGGVLINASRNWTYSGLIDAVKVWNYGMTTTQVQQDMNQVLSGAEPGLEAYYRMSNGSGMLLTDDSIHTWDGTLYDGTNNVPPDGPPQWIPPGVD